MSDGRWRTRSDVEPQDLPEQRVGVLSVTLWVALGATVAGGEVEPSVQPEQELAAVVIVGLVMLDRDHGRPDAVSVLIQLEVAAVVVVEDEHPVGDRVVRGYGERQEALLSAVLDP